jgi:hypothetical protein
MADRHAGREGLAHRAQPTQSTADDDNLELDPDQLARP